MDKVSLITAIEEAFDGVEYSDTSLRQFRLTDQYGLVREIAKKEWSSAGKDRVDTKWQDIPDSEIEECDCLLAHMQAGEFRYFLPAYMRYSIKHIRTPIEETDILGLTVFSLYPSTKNTDTYNYKISQLSLLNDTQKLVVVEFLRLVASEAEYLQRPNALKALERWAINLPSG